MKKIDLLIIDPQEDFCNPNGALYVKGADQDMIRLAEMIIKKCDKINNIHVSLDSHHLIHIAHPIWWQDKDGNPPNPFTIISSKDVTGENPVWKAKESIFVKRSIEYVKLLENANKNLCIWPPHCLIASKGGAIFEFLFNSLLTWETKQFSLVHKFTKGSNIFTEQFSILKAEIPDKDDPDTELNNDLIDRLKESDMILVSGEALSHCVKETITDLVNYGLDVKKITLLEDTSSPVIGFEDKSYEFIQIMKMRGMQVINTKDF